MQNKVRWCVFLGGFATFVAGVEILHRNSDQQDSIYQCRILIDKDFSMDEAGPEEEVKSEKISLYTKTKYGVLPRKQSDPRKIFDAYRSKVECTGDYLRVAILAEDIDEKTIGEISEKFPDSKLSFVIPHYTKDIDKIAENVISAGHEFFIQLPTQSSIPQEKKNTVSPFLANVSAKDMTEKLNYLIASVKYAIGIANTSDSLVTKSRKDMEIIARELSERGLAFLDASDDGDTVAEVSERIKLLSLKAKTFDKSSPLVAKGVVLLNSKQLDDFTKVLPKDVKLVPVSFGVKNVSL